MGLLDNSTNNILVDAVLTEAGREAFASNGANLDEAGLVIVKFALGDDEVDYTNVVKFGLEFGRERIEKLTPVFESSTNSGLAIRSFLTTYANDDLEYLPRLQLEGTDQTVALKRTGATSETSKTLTFTLQIGTGANLTADQRDPVYIVRVPGRFLSLQGRTPIGVLPDRTEIYEIPQTGQTGQITFTLAVKPFANELFDTFGAPSGSPDIIRTRFSITGIATGATKEILVNISRR